MCPVGRREEQLGQEQIVKTLLGPQGIWILLVQEPKGRRGKSDWKAEIESPIWKETFEKARQSEKGLIIGGRNDKNQGESCPVGTITKIRNANNDKTNKKVFEIAKKIK